MRDEAIRLYEQELKQRINPKQDTDVSNQLITYSLSRFRENLDKVLRGQYPDSTEEGYRALLAGAKTMGYIVLCDRWVFKDEIDAWLFAGYWGVL